jgi:predicted kinase
MTTQQVLVQMSGAPGAGKTTISRALAPHLGAVVLDHDVSKSALLDAEVPVALAGRASYAVLLALAAQLVQQGFSVILDSPCFYANLLLRGQQIANEAGARYRYIECRLDDLDVLDHRLRTRPRMPSQVAGVWAQPTAGSGKSQVGASVFRAWIAGMKRPASGGLVLDTSRPLADCLAEALAYITESAERG